MRPLIAAAFVASVLSSAPLPAGASSTAPALPAAPAQQAGGDIPEGSAFVPLSPCRTVDTRNSGGALTADTQRAFQISGTGAGFAAQGGKPGGCNIPTQAIAVEASITAVAPQGNGFLRAWGSGGPTATFLNYTKNQGITNTGTIDLGTATKDLTIRNFGSTSHYVIDVQGYFIPIGSAVTVDAGWHHSCALLADSTIKCWGMNDSGQLGNSNTHATSAPVTVTGITNATAISAGGQHSCARLANGTVKCWGRNQQGQLGNGTKTSSSSPVTVTGITNATAISAGIQHTCARLATGAVKCWGYNNPGQLGNGTTTSTTTPVTVQGITTATDIAAGEYHSCAVLNDGTMKCWGYNDFGVLGNGTTAHSPVPVTVAGSATSSQMSVTFQHTCARMVNGTVTCWGRNHLGQLGNSGGDRTTPLAVPSITTASMISTGESHTCAGLANGTIKCWGLNDNGRLGNGTVSGGGTGSGGPTPSSVVGITKATSISAGSSHTCARLQDGTIRCWGDAAHRALGNGSYSDSSTPVKVYWL